MTKSLRSHALPSRALLLIHDYSLPITRSDWRESIPIITTRCLYSHVSYLNNYNCNHYSPPKYVLDYNLLCNILETDWYHRYKHVL